jgi:hypothetical protein
MTCHALAVVIWHVQAACGSCLTRCPAPLLLLLQASWNVAAFSWWLQQEVQVTGVVTGLDSAAERRLLDKQTASVFAAFDHNADGVVNMTEWADTLLWHELRELLCKVQPGSGAKALVLPGGRAAGLSSVGRRCMLWPLLLA